MKTKLTNRKDRAGFTLVEMLVVILIIGILAGLISATAIRALKRAKVARIAMEIKQLAMALEESHHGVGHKSGSGEYSPDFAGLDSSDINIKSAAQQKVLDYIRNRWARFTVPDWNTLRNTILLNSNNTLDINNMSPATALVFWLGGMPDDHGRLSGFSQDPSNPFSNVDIATRKPIFDFDPGRLKNYQYYPSGITSQPYIYLRAEGQSDNREYYIRDTSTTPPSYTFKSGSASGAKPYWDQRTKGWVNYKSYQILCCGLDGIFGKENVYPTGLIAGAGVPDGTGGTPDLRPDVMGTDSTAPTPFPTGNFDHLDDQTNFASGTIGDDLP